MYFEGMPYSEFPMGKREAKNDFLPCVYKYRSFTPYLFSGLKNNTFFLNHTSEFNDPFELLGKDYIDSVYGNSSILYNKIMEDLRISCFSKAADIPLMWAYYADSLKGVVIEYDLSLALSSNLLKHCYVGPVIYREDKLIPSTRLQEIMYSEDRNEDLISMQETEYRKQVYLEQLIFSKFSDYSHEDEWRLILHNKNFSSENNGRGVACTYNKNTIKSIIFGERADPKQVQKIKKIVPNVTYKKAVRSKTHHKIDIIDL